MFLRINEEDFEDLITKKEGKVYIRLYSDMIYSVCPKCDKEIEIDSNELLCILQDGGDFTTNTYCEECSKEIIENKQKGE